MSNKALNWARKIPLLMGERSLLMMLANSFNEKKGCCYPTNKTLARWCSCSERTIRRCIKSLISKNIIQKEEVRNQLGHRVTFKYTLNFDLNLDILPDNLSCGKVQSLPDNLSSLPDNLSKPTGHDVRKDYILNQNINQKKTKDFSLGDNSNTQKQQTIIGIKFEQLRKIYGDSYDIQNAKRLYLKICLEDDRPVQFAENLLKVRKQQIIDFKKQTSSGKLMPAPCSLTNWMKGERWNDIITPLGKKKKVNPYMKCKQCGEEYLKGTYCKMCARKSEARLAYA